MQAPAGRDPGTIAGCSILRNSTPSSASDPSRLHTSSCRLFGRHWLSFRCKHARPTCPSREEELTESTIQMSRPISSQKLNFHRSRGRTPNATGEARGHASRRARRPQHHDMNRSRRPHQQRHAAAASRGGALASSASTSVSTAETGAAGTASPGGAFAEELGVLDEEQAAMMAEECILVDRNDRPTGCASKVCVCRTMRRRVRVLRLHDDGSGRSTLVEGGDSGTRAGSCACRGRSSLCRIRYFIHLLSLR